MKLIRKCPLFLLLISSIILLTIVGIAGKLTVYAQMDYDPVKTPVLALVFTGWNENIYPWQIWESPAASVETGSFGGEDKEAGEMETAETENTGTENAEAETAEQEAEEEGNAEAEAADDKEAANEAEKEDGSGNQDTPMPSMTPQEAAAWERSRQEGRLEPLRESTQEEYLNHISADIYGDAGVLRAAQYEFTAVDESYFDDALFIGDSRTVGLHDYTTLAEHADFYCETSLTIYKALEENFKGKGTIRDALAQKEYGKIYIMVGINELGRGTTEDFMSQYTEVVDTLHELEPDALIFIQGIMRVSAAKNDSDAIFNNSNINARNNAIATLADNEQIFYIDVNEVVCDENGNLREDYTFDQIHLLGMYNDLWKEFLLEHGVK